MKFATTMWILTPHTFSVDVLCFHLAQMHKWIALLIVCLFWTKIFSSVLFSFVLKFRRFKVRSYLFLKNAKKKNYFMSICSHLRAKWLARFIKKAELFLNDTRSEIHRSLILVNGTDWQEMTQPSVICTHTRQHNRTSCSVNFTGTCAQPLGWIWDCSWNFIERNRTFELLLW